MCGIGRGEEKTADKVEKFEGKERKREGGRGESLMGCDIKRAKCVGAFVGVCNSPRCSQLVSVQYCSSVTVFALWRA